MGEQLNGLTEIAACHAVMRERYRRNFCLHRYTPAHWWECDVFEVTESGYFNEYEIKLTLKDFKDDAKKKQVIRQYVHGQGFVESETRHKHTLLGKSAPPAPSGFYFVVPEPLADDVAKILPAFAGLMVLADMGEGYRGHWRYRPHVRVKAPVIHRVKLAPEILTNARAVCYYRMHDLLYQSLR